MSPIDTCRRYLITTETKTPRNILLFICTIALLTETAWAADSANPFYSDSTKAYQKSKIPEFLLREDLRPPENAKMLLVITSEVTFGFSKYDGSLGNGDIFTQTIEADGTADMMSFSQWRIDEYEDPDFGVNMQDGGPASTVTDPNGDNFQFVSFTTEVFCGTPMSFDVVGYEDGSPVSGATKSYTLSSEGGPVVRSVGFASVDEIRFENYSRADGNQCLTVDDFKVDQAVSSNTQPSYANLDATVTFDETAGSPVIIDGDATISDAELDGANDYAGSSLTVERTGGANGNDDFSFDTSAGTFTVSGGDLLAGGNVFASFTESGGILTINFNSSQAAATSGLVDDVLQAITYANIGDPAVVEYDLTLTFNDGDALQTATSLPVVFDPELAPITTNTTFNLTPLEPVLSNGDPIDARIIQELLFYGFEFGDATENDLINSSELHLEQVTSDPNTTNTLFESDGTFLLESIDIDNFSTIAQDVTVYGYLNGTLKSSETFSFGGESNYQTKALGFTGIDEVRFTTSENNVVAIDNIVVDKDTENTALKNSASLTFNGTDNYVNLAGVADDMAGVSSMTVEFWAKPDIANQSDPDGVSLFGLNTASGDNLLLIFIGTSTTQDHKVHIYDGPGDSDFDLTGPELTDGKWHHIAYSFDSGTGTLYVDGHEVGQNNIPLTLSSDDQWSLGQEYDSGSPGDFFKGQIDELRIWNTARTTQQIQGNLFQPMEGDETGLAGFWPFNNSVYDYGPNNNNAALVNNPAFSSNTHPLGTLIHGSEGWRMMGSPTASISYGTLLSSIFTQGFTGAMFENGIPNVYTWNEGNGAADTTARGFVPINSASENPAAGQGFITYTFADEDPDAGGTQVGFPKMVRVGQPQQTGTISFPVTLTKQGGTYTPDRDGFNLVSNPYGATINWDATSGWTKTNIDNTIYVWDHSASGGAGAYRAWNGADGTLPNGLIAPWQGFWVKANNNGPPVLKATDDVRGAGGVYYKSAGDSLITRPIPVLSLQLTEGSTEDSDKLHSTTVLMLHPEGATGRDPLDAYKMASLNSDRSLSLYTTAGGNALDINTLPWGLLEQEGSSLGIPMDFSGSDVGGSYTLSWTPEKFPEELSIELIDSYTEETISLDSSGEYTFTVGDTTHKSHAQTARDGKRALKHPTHRAMPTILKGKAKNHRFIVKIAQANDSNTQLPQKLSISPAYPNPFSQQCHVDVAMPEQTHVRVDIYDVLGRKITTMMDKQMPAGNHTMTMDAEAIGLASGVYICRLQVGDHSETLKMTFIK